MKCRDPDFYEWQAWLISHASVDAAGEYGAAMAKWNEMREIAIAAVQNKDMRTIAKATTVVKEVNAAWARLVKTVPPDVLKEYERGRRACVEAAMAHEQGLKESPDDRSLH